METKDNPSEATQPENVEPEAHKRQYKEMIFVGKLLKRFFYVFFVNVPCVRCESPDIPSDPNQPEVVIDK